MELIVWMRNVEVIKEAVLTYARKNLCGMWMVGCGHVTNGSEWWNEKV